MASAQDYANWIVANKDKQGTPEFDTVARAYQIAKAQQPVTQEAAPSPLGSNMENFAAGAGKAVMDTYRGIKQLGARYEDLKTNLGLNPAGMPLLSPDADAAVNEAKRLDAPLMNTKAGLGGNLAGNAATFALAAPAATTVKGAAVVGGLAGAMQPVADGESRLVNTGLGAAAGAAGQYGANKIGDYFANRAVQQAALKAQNAPKDAAVAAAQDAGYVIPPTQANPSLVNRALEGLSGKIQTGQGASVKNQPVTNNLARESLGLAPDAPLNAETLNGLRKTAGQAYEAIKTLPNRFVADGQFQTDIKAIGNDFSAAATEFPDLLKNDAIETLKTALSKPDMSPASAIELTKKLRFDASKNFKAFSDPEKLALADAQYDAAKAIEGMIERNIPDPKLLENFRNARQLYAKTYDVQSALNDTTGNVSAPILAKLMDKGSPLTGGLKQAADFSKTFPKAAQNIDTIGSAPGFSPLDAAAAAGMAAAGHNYGAVGSIIGRPIVRSAILSQPYQNAFLQQTYGPSMAGQLLTSQPANALLRSSPVAAALTNRR